MSSTRNPLTADSLDENLFPEYLELRASFVSSPENLFCLLNELVHAKLVASCLSTNCDWRTYTRQDKVISPLKQKLFFLGKKIGLNILILERQ